MEAVKEHIKETVSAGIHCPHPDGTYTVKFEWSPRMVSVDIPRFTWTNLFVNLTVEEIEKLAKDLFKIVEERNGHL